MMLTAVTVSLALWFLLLIMPWRSWLNGEVLETEVSKPVSGASDVAVTVLIPARNESDYILDTLSALSQQSLPARLVVIDDHSTDETATLVAQHYPEVQLINCQIRPDGWSGKLWALHNGLGQVNTSLVLLLDADISLEKEALRQLVALQQSRSLGLVSVMARLRNLSFWEKLLIPAFVFFFKQIYPFRLSNSLWPQVAAAAGGCMLAETSALRLSGGFEAIKGEIIDDCSLARQLKSAGYRTWIGMSHEVQSRRVYDSLESIWHMVERTAFTQLGCSWVWLLLCSTLMILCFWVPLAGLFFSEARLMSFLGLSFMTIAYLPTLYFYRQSPVWGLFLPVIGTLYLAMTWSSAIKSWVGKGAEWKGRHYP